MLTFYILIVPFGRLFEIHLGTTYMQTISVINTHGPQVSQPPPIDHIKRILVQHTNSRSTGQCTRIIQAINILPQLGLIVLTFCQGLAYLACCCLFQFDSFTTSGFTNSGPRAGNYHQKPVIHFWQANIFLVQQISSELLQKISRQLQE